MSDVNTTVADFVRRLRDAAERAKQAKFTTCNLGVLEVVHAGDLADYLAKTMEDNALVEYAAAMMGVKVAPLVWLAHRNLRDDSGNYYPVVWRASGANFGYEVASDAGGAYWSAESLILGSVTNEAAPNEEAAKERAQAHHREHLYQFFEAGVSTEIHAGPIDAMKEHLCGLVEQLAQTAAHSPFWSEYQCTYINKVIAEMKAAKLVESEDGAEPGEPEDSEAQDS